MMVIDKGLQESFYKEFKWNWSQDKKVLVHFITKKVRRDRYNGTIFFIDEIVPDMEDIEDDDNSTINMVTITRQLTTHDIDKIQQIITEEYGVGTVSDELSSKHLVLIHENQSYIR